MLTLWTVRLACLFYFAALAAWITGRRDRARAAWTAGLSFYLLHAAAAFSFHHHWSHAAAYRETARQTAELFGFDWGGGLYFNYVFTAVWMADAGWLWRRPHSYYGRARWISAAVHGFLAFMVVNGAIVFASAPMRWASIAACLLLIGLARKSAQRESAGAPKTSSHSE